MLYFNLEWYALVTAVVQSLSKSFRENKAGWSLWREMLTRENSNEIR